MVDRVKVNVSFFLIVLVLVYGAVNSSVGRVKAPFVLMILVLV